MTIFKWKNEFPKQLGLEKQTKKWGHLSGFHVSFLSYGPSIVKNCVFSAFFTDVSNKSEAVIAVYVYAFEISRFTLLENGIGYYAMTHSLEGISV